MKEEIWSLGIGILCVDHCRPTGSYSAPQSKGKLPYYDNCVLHYTSSMMATSL